MKNIQHVFFDLDHTLWDFEKNSDLTFQKVFLEYDVAVDITLFLKVYKPINFKYWKLFREEKVTKKTLRFGRLKDSFDALNYSISEDLINVLAIKYLEFLSDYNHLFDGTFEILDYLKDKYKLHIITNGFQEVQLLKLKNSGISNFFKTVTSSEEVGVKKPNPLVFETALQKGNTKASQSIMIGDSFEADILGALNIGMKAIFFGNYINDLEKNILQVDNLIHLKKYL